MAVEGARETVRESFEKACARRDPASCRRALAVSSSLRILSAAEKEGKKDIRLAIRATAREGDDLLSAVLPIARTSLCVVLQGPSCSCLPSRSPAADTAEPATPALQYAAHPPRPDRQTDTPHAAVVRLKLYHQPRFPNIDSRYRQTRDMKSLRLC